MSRRRRIEEGAVAGIIGASTVAVWFLVVDLVRGEPLYTPALLGDAVFSVLKIHASEAVWPVLAYTVIHYAAFMLVGVFAVMVVEASNKSPALLAGLFLLFAVFEVGFYFLCWILAMLTVVGQLARYQILAANFLASLTMGT